MLQIKWGDKILFGDQESKEPDIRVLGLTGKRKTILIFVKYLSVKSIR